MFDFFSGSGDLPQPYDANRLDNGFVDWKNLTSTTRYQTLGNFITRIADDATGQRYLSAIFGNSPFLARCVLRDPEFVAELANASPEDIRDTLFLRVREECRAAKNEADIMKILRQSKSRLALLTATADLTGTWALETITASLSDFASLALNLSLEFLLRAEAALGSIELDDLDDPCRSSGLVVIGMGKLGAGELNYSSDIDLIVLWDQEVVRYTGRRGPEEGFVRLTRNLVRIMQERTADGYVFRTDLRLRPDAGATPVALSMLAAEGYYESVGQNWERAAMIKASPVAGDIQAGKEFLKRISPFVWRKFLDFAAIDDIHSIKRQINRHKGHSTVTVPGHNIKVGRGGIREIEFFAQTQQLIAGGRDSTLRVSPTCLALRALATSNRIGNDVADQMIASYTYLRQLEHRLQMIADEQTQTLPSEPDSLLHLAVFFGYAELADFETDLLSHLTRVEGHYANLFEESPDLTMDSDVAGNLVFTGTDEDPETSTTLVNMGYSDPATVSAAIRRWHHGRYRATRSVRSRELLTELMPVLLTALADTANPDAALLKFDEFLGKLPAGVQLFSLFHANPDLLDLVAEIMGGAPRLAEYLSRNATLLDGVISSDFYDHLPNQETLRDELETILAGARDTQDVLDFVRRWSHGRRFQVGVQILRSLADITQSGLCLSDMADVAIGAMLPRLLSELSERHGLIPGGQFVVIAMGKLGAQEMTAGSDLDLTFVYDHPDDVSFSDGEKPLSASEYYARLSKRLINALTAMTAEGHLYDVDMRLRPSGAAGPIAVRLNGFRKYQQEEAWTWEHMAMIRARIVAGPDELASKVMAVVQEALCISRDDEELRNAIADMRDRIDQERHTKNPWSTKYVRGGVVDIEFISQYLILKNATKTPEIIDGKTARAFRKLSNAGYLDQDLANDLIEGTMLMRTLQGILRQTTVDVFEESDAPEGLKSALAKANNEPTFESLKIKVEETEAHLFVQFDKIIGVPTKR
ncbi:MAG: bifunctional [glutamine synthetase] adenylyltransferase/[glutamine synthetase]-adenylyl-L-tyrosine phosphorylase [Alphaproteobacteria bacterium]|nr:bifunctional [glutamine synthetase] adenylyltransferase/[glutamine synthetase]-adenylyl-L-tyrosine phosphorylase [Alphaproteobacteria bacterium]MBT4019256.1 bifunctional [glutamine synthetase] adenylyltransferase/[glutamine synthetase]-adenylyl-L-tyrosine phosphorylase [Alphaproteobacteria bacterium]MBT4967200.1 bifunctional [glutamine synthetase] adenylyltransferase/[glutamine synthetase]-adenylyl-L-tyrosine phosphorylase [Alphaproteobacteria bacterium]MBT5159938.1 bifunctional [glutamine sy